MTDLDLRRRRAAYRAAHRGTKEMDWLLGRYATSELAAMSEAGLAEFELLLSLPDPELQGWLMTGDMKGPSDLAALVERIRRFHGLGTHDGASRTC
ncbi:MAG: succinate dehydrogenase assembly factor 2 [Hyphomicrobiaceae bacterium]